LYADLKLPKFPKADSTTPQEQGHPAFHGGSHHRPSGDGRSKVVRRKHREAHGHGASEGEDETAAIIQIDALKN
jgi:hypothetical protein